MSPRQTYDTKADYDAISYRVVPGQPAAADKALYHYHVNHEFPWHETLADWLITSSGFDLTRVAIIGSGFPWTQQALHAHPSLTIPLGTVASQDTSAYVQASSAEEPEHRAELTRVGLDPDTTGAALLAQMDGGPRLAFGVEDRPISGGAGRAGVRQLCGGRPTFCYSELVIESLFEAEILDLTDDMKAIGNNQTTYAHMVVRPQKSRSRPQFDIRSLAEWRLFFDANGHTDVVLIDGTTFEVS